MKVSMLQTVPVGLYKINHIGYFFICMVRFFAMYVI